MRSLPVFPAAPPWWTEQREPKGKLYPRCSCESPLPTYLSLDSPVFLYLQSWSTSPSFPPVWAHTDAACTAQRSAAPYLTAPRFTAWHCTAWHLTALCLTALQDTAPYCTALHGATRHGTTLQQGLGQSTFGPLGLGSTAPWCNHLTDLPDREQSTTVTAMQAGLPSSNWA